jgi:hypothetical protein
MQEFLDYLTYLVIILSLLTPSSILLLPYTLRENFPLTVVYFTGLRSLPLQLLFMIYEWSLKTSAPSVNTAMFPSVSQEGRQELVMGSEVF